MAALRISRSVVGLLLSAAPLALAIGTPAFAQTAQDFADMRREIAALKAEQAESRARIAQLEAERDFARTAPAVRSVAPSSAPPVALAAAAVPTSAAAPVNPAGGSAPGIAPQAAPSRLALNGDVRVRYESNFGLDNVRDRDRLVLRARLRGTYAINKWLSIGGQVATGDNDDPNSTDITLGNFDDDLTVSLDQAYLRGIFGGLTVVAGKIPQPFARTELVWDGDVSPQGLSVSYKAPLGSGASIKANGLYFVIDDSVGGKDSRMFGGQLQAETDPSRPVKLELAAGYYDYHLTSTAGGDNGDFRTNRFAAGRYLSDFNLLDVIGAVQFNGLGERWPVRLVGDYVHNYGATTDQDSGFGIDLLVGRGAKLGDWRFGYGYAQADVDAILTAFSHDNTNLASNYLQHTVLVDHVIAPNVILNATYYRYRAKSPLFTTAFSTRDWADRVRLNILANF